jgi:hypothetical protein
MPNYGNNHLQASSYEHFKRGQLIPGSPQSQRKANQPKLRHEESCSGVPSKVQVIVP